MLQKKDRLRAEAGKYVEDAAKPVFTDELGRRVSPLTATKAYARIAAVASASSVRLHDARHSAASHLIHAGVDIKSVSAILGHASANTTLGVYAHLLGDAQRDAIDRLGDRLDRIVAGGPKPT